MIVEKDDLMPILTPEDVVRVRREVRTQAIAVGFSLVDQTKIITAASEPLGSHTYSSTGTYFVTVTVALGTTPPEASFTTGHTLCRPETKVPFYNNL